MTLLANCVILGFVLLAWLGVEHPFKGLLLANRVAQLHHFDLLEGESDCFFHPIVTLKLHSMVKALLRSLQLPDLYVGNTFPVEGFHVGGVVLEGLGGILDRVVVLLHLDVAEGEVDAHEDLNFFDQLDSFFGGLHDGVLRHFEHHLEGEKRLVVVLDCTLVVSLRDAQIAVEALNVGHFQLLLARVHRIVD